MIKVLLSDFAGVLLFPTDNNYFGTLNSLHNELSTRGDYNFGEYFKLNKDLLAYYKTLKDKINLYMFTSEHIQEHPAVASELADIFQTIFSGTHLNLIKSDPQSYQFIVQKIGLKPEEVLFIDDSPTNIEAAKKVGLATIQYKSNEQVKMDIEQLL